ncbi:Transmembrane protein 41B [Dissophora globulifera]|nr:Transmembrane protein 41B [Dissophora globulifera]
MSSSIVNDTTPLLGNVPGSSASPSTKKSPKKDGVRQHLLDMTPMQSFIALIVLAATVFLGVFVMLKYNLPKDLPDGQKEWLKFPRSAEDVQHLSIVLEMYLAQHYYEVLVCFITTYVSLQAFAIPGTVMLSVLGGALFKFWIGLFVVLLCAGVGALCCYSISYYLGHPIVEKYLKARIAKLQVKVSLCMCMYWFMNVASPHLGISAPIFFFGTLVGVLPNSLVTVQAGVTLAALASPDDFTLFTPQNIIMTVVVGVCLLLPIVLHRKHGDPMATSQPAEEGTSNV